MGLSIRLALRVRRAKLRPMTQEFRFQRSARQPKSMAITGAALVALIGAVLVLHIHPVIAAIFALLLLPALWDIASNTRSELTLDTDTLSWRMGGRGDTFQLGEIERVNNKLSLDFSQKAVILMKTGARHRIPPPCVPPDGSLDAALSARDVAVERSLF